MRYESFKENNERYLRVINDENETVAVLRIGIQDGSIIAYSIDEYTEAWERLPECIKNEAIDYVKEIYKA